MFSLNSANSVTKNESSAPFRKNSIRHGCDSNQGPAYITTFFSYILFFYNRRSKIVCPFVGNTCLQLNQEMHTRLDISKHCHKSTPTMPKCKCQVSNVKRLTIRINWFISFILVFRMTPLLFSLFWLIPCISDRNLIIFNSKTNPHLKIDHFPTLESTSCVRSAVLVLI